MYKRKIADALLERLRYYPVVSVTGPRQSGKSTLLKSVLKDYQYVTLEDKDYRENAISDPRGFLENYEKNLIIDEAQYAPDLFSFIQTTVDNTNKVGQYVLSGSQNFLLSKNISQSLSGRVGILKLLPFSYLETKNKSLDAANFIFNGGYPDIYAKKTPNNMFFDSYIETYLERDIRTTTNIGNLVKFKNFIKIIASQAGELVNFDKLAITASIDVKTVKSWLSILESSYIIFLLQPYYNNHQKRITKTPKLYFYDTGLASYLKSIDSVDTLKASSDFGHLFENMVINEVQKNFFNSGIKKDLYFWRENNENEIDLMLENSAKTFGFEIKKSMTQRDEHLKGINRFNTISNNGLANKGIIYDGEPYATDFKQYFNWKSLNNILI
jgi:predicted AAA+ superfamily ATPase